MSRPRRNYEDLSPSHVRRLKAAALARSALAGALLFVAYYLLPLNKPETTAVLLLVGGLIVIAVVLVWQVRAIVDAPFPRLRGFQTLISGIPLLLVVFAAVIYLTGQAQPDSFTEPMDKIGAMYFTVTVFCTVGFGDITAPHTRPNRSPTTTPLAHDHPGERHPTAGPARWTTQRVSAGRMT